MYTSIYIYSYICSHVHTYLCKYIWYKRIYTYVYIYISTHNCSTSICLMIPSSACHILGKIYINIYTYVYICTYIYPQYSTEIYLNNTLQRLPRFGRNFSDNSEINEGYAAVTEHKQVACVNIGVETAAAHHTCGPRVECLYMKATSRRHYAWLTFQKEHQTDTISC